LERSIDSKKLARYQEEYSIDMTEDQKNKVITRGLLVIKRTKQTKAGQRKHAVANWKVQLIMKYFYQYNTKLLTNFQRLVRKTLRDIAASKTKKVSAITEKVASAKMTLRRTDSTAVKNMVVSMLKEDDFQVVRGLSARPASKMQQLPTVDEVCSFFKHFSHFFTFFNEIFVVLSNDKKWLYLGNS